MRNHPRPTCTSINSTAPPQKKKTSVNSTGWRPLHTICITVLAHPASPAADDPDLQLHPGGAVPRRAADEVALPGAVEPDRVAAGHERGRPAGCRSSRGARGQEPLEEELALAGPGRCDQRVEGGRQKPPPRRRDVVSASLRRATRRAAEAARLQRPARPGGRRPEYRPGADGISNTVHPRAPF